MFNKKTFFIALIAALLLTSCAPKPDGEVSYDDIAGSWYLENSTSYYSLNADGAFIFRTMEETYGGFYTWDGESVVLSYEDLNKTVSLTLTEENKLLDSGTGDIYIKNISGDSSKNAG